MKVKLHDTRGLIVVPETEFETEVLVKMFRSDSKAWLKSGLTPADTVGLVIEPVKKVEEKPLTTEK